VAISGKKLKMRKNLNTILPLAISVLLVLLPPAITGRIRMFAATPLRPVGEARRALAANVNAIFAYPSTEREAALARENERLLQELSAVQGRLSDTRAALSGLGAFRENRRRYGSADEPFVAAAVIFKGGTGPARRLIYIDRGASDGISEGMPVVCGDSLVGVVNAVGPAMSEVIVLGDPRLKVRSFLLSPGKDSAAPANDRAAGLLAGTASPQAPLRLQFIWRQVAVARDDLVLTSGYDGSFPRGIIAGRVANVAEQRGDLHHLIEVAPAFDFESIDQVLILTAYPRPYGQGP
jgi:rod shape-determining protein MreC